MDSKQDSHMRIDPDGKRLQIDDLIIIPNNLHTPGAAGTEGTGVPVDLGNCPKGCWAETTVTFSRALV